MKGKKVPGPETAEDSYHALLEGITSRLDGPEFAPLHSLIEEIVEGVRKIVGEGHECQVRKKTDKVLRAAIESRLTRQMAAANGEVRPHRKKRRILDWRNLSTVFLFLAGFCFLEPASSFGPLSLESGLFICFVSLLYLKPGVNIFQYKI